LTCFDPPEPRVAVSSAAQSLEPLLSWGPPLSSPTVSADVMTAARTDETAAETDEMTAAIAGELACNQGNDQRILDLRRGRWGATPVPDCVLNHG
jgi:hypothetical protein